LLVIGGISLLAGLGLSYIFQNKKQIKEAHEPETPKSEKSKKINHFKKHPPKSPRRQHSENSNSFWILMNSFIIRFSIKTWT